MGSFNFGISGRYRSLATMRGRVHVKIRIGPGLVGMGGDSSSEGRGFESWRCILDGYAIDLL